MSGKEHGHTKGVITLLGDPKKAVLKLSAPLVIAMTAQTIYNLVDAIWVSGLGADALSAVGFFFPIMFFLTAMAAGLTIGGGSAISRRIGAADKGGADSVAVHMLLLFLSVSVIIAVPAFIMAPDIFRAFGAGGVTDLATSYGRIMFLGTPIVFFPQIATSILRGEGDTKRTMYAMLLGAVANVILDPIFIYLPPFEMGVAGAAWATLLSLLLSSALLSYWLFFKRDTYISFKRSNLKPRWDVVKDIMRVGVPASLQQMSISFNVMIMTLLVVRIGGTDGVAVFSSGWRVTSFAVIPLMGMAGALTSIAGAAYGQRDFKKLNTAFIYSVKVGLVIEMVFSTVLFLFPSQIAMVFTWSEGSAHLSSDLVTFFRVTSLVHFSAAFGMLSSSVFQAVGKGFHSLVLTLLRTIVFSAIAAWFLGYYLGLGLVGVWFGMAIGNISGAVISYGWLMLSLKRLRAKDGLSA